MSVYERLGVTPFDSKYIYTTIYVYRFLQDPRTNGVGSHAFIFHYPFKENLVDFYYILDSRLSHIQIGTRATPQPTA